MAALPEYPSPSERGAVVRESQSAAEVLHLFGQFDFVSAPDLESELVRSVRIGKPLIVNLRDCTFIDAAVVGVLVRAHRALGTRLRIVASRAPLPRQVFTILGLDAAFHMAPSLEDAFAGETCEEAAVSAG